MRIGILTFHRAHNYGAMLQGYALKEVVKGLGGNVSVIDYAPAYIDAQYQYFRLGKNIKRNILNIFNLRGNKAKQKKFEQFKNTFFNLVPFETEEKFDVLIYGSDQIWNPNISNSFDEVYFGKHGIYTLKNVSYAASIGKSYFTKEELDEVSELLEGFNAVSAREETATTVLQSVYKKRIETVLDPTLLMETSQWDKIAVHPKINSPYILVYEVNKDPKTMEIARKMSLKTGFPICEISYCKTRLFSDHKILTGIGPEEFIGLIRDAEYIVTSSFHGTAFSLCYKKNFYTVAHRTYGSRMVDLLTKLGLANRIIDEMPNTLESIFYDRGVDEKLKLEKEKSIEFLKRNVF